MFWTPERVGTFRRSGYIQLPGAVEPAAVHRALRLINGNLRTDGLDPERWQHYESTSFCAASRGEAAITELLTGTSVWSILEAALGRGRVAPPARGQIALRFPEERELRVDPHMDGTHYLGNRIEPGTLNNFTLLVGVLLSDLPKPWSGNLTVWPGSHARNWEHLGRHGVAGFPNGLGQTGGAPCQITGRAGDVVLAHYFLSHGVAPNAAADVRYAVYFRIRTVDFDPSAARAQLWWGWGGAAFQPA